MKYHTRHDSSNSHDEPNVQPPSLSIFQVNILNEYSMVHMNNQHYPKYVLDFFLIVYNLQFNSLLLMTVLSHQKVILLTFLIINHPLHFTFKKKPFDLLLFKVQQLDLFYFQLLTLNHPNAHCYLDCFNVNNTCSFNFDSIYLLQILLLQDLILI